MSTPINLATQAYLADNTTLSGGVIRPTIDPLAGSVILTVPNLGPGGAGIIYVTGTFNAPNLGLYSALSADAAGWTNSAEYTLYSPSGVSASPTTQTAAYAFGAGVEQYDDAITAGETFVLVNPANTWHEITAISFDYSEPGGVIVPVTSAPRQNRARPLRQWPRNDGLGMTSARRIWPPPRSIQASNRRAGGYL